MTGGEPRETAPKSGAWRTGPMGEVAVMNLVHFLGGLLGWVWILYWGVEFLFFETTLAFTDRYLGPLTDLFGGVAFFPVGFGLAGLLIAFFHAHRWPKAPYVAVGLAGFVAVTLVVRGIHAATVVGILLPLVLIPLAVGFGLGATLRLPTRMGLDDAAASRFRFTDPQLETAVRAALARPDGVVTDPMLARLERLDAVHMGITSLAGLEHATNLTALGLSHNGITDVGPLKYLRALETVNLSHNDIADISALPEPGFSHLTREVLDTALRSLDLSANRVSDVGALVKLARLETVDLRGNPLDLTPGSATLEHVQFLRERGVEVLVDEE